MEIARFVANKRFCLASSSCSDGDMVCSSSVCRGLLQAWSLSNTWKYPSVASLLTFALFCDSTVVLLSLGELKELVVVHSVLSLAPSFASAKKIRSGNVGEAGGQHPRDCQWGYIYEGGYA